VNNHQLQALLGSSVVELDFIRRHPKAGWSDVRGLIGTTNPKLLNSEFGFGVLHFKPPKGGGMGYDYKSKGLCVVWDIFRQEFRVFGAEQVKIHEQQWPLGTDEEIEAFQNYIINDISKMSNDDKIKFMGYTGTVQHLPAPTPAQEPEQPPTVAQWIQKKWDGVVSRGAQFANWVRGKKK